MGGSNRSTLSAQIEVHYAKSWLTKCWKVTSIKFKLYHNIVI
jgi:hypothetical protein